MMQDETVWACLAAMAVNAHHLDTAEEAFAAINQIDKVVFIQHIKVKLDGPLLLIKGYIISLQIRIIFGFHVMQNGFIINYNNALTLRSWNYFIF